MSNQSFTFKQFEIRQEKAAFKVGTDGVLLGATAIVESVSRILDIGTGTGLVAIMLAQRSNAEITAIEPDHESYLQCCGNVERCRWRDRITVQNTSIQDFDSASLFDLIVTNPPFFSDSLKNTDPRRSASRHNDSLKSDDLLKNVLRLMTESGNFHLVMPYTEGNIFIAEANQYGLFCNSILKIRPLPHSDIRRLIMTFSRKRKRTVEKFLTIEHGRRYEFTEEYRSLTRDFYLKF